MPNFQPVQPGDAFRPEADEWNAMLRTAWDNQRGLERRVNATSAGSAVVVPIKNNTGGARGRYSVASLGAALGDLDANSDLRQFVFSADSYADGAWPVVFQSSLADGAVGFGVVSGPTLVDVDTGGAETQQYAVPNSSYKAAPADSGSIYIPGGTETPGIKLGVVGPPASSAPRHVIQSFHPGGGGVHTLHGVDLTLSKAGNATRLTANRDGTWLLRINLWYDTRAMSRGVYTAQFDFSHNAVTGGGVSVEGQGLGSDVWRHARYFEKELVSGFYEPVARVADSFQVVFVLNSGAYLDITPTFEYYSLYSGGVLGPYNHGLVYWYGSVSPDIEYWNGYNAGFPSGVS